MLAETIDHDRFSMFDAARARGAMHTALTCAIPVTHDNHPPTAKPLPCAVAPRVNAPENSLPVTAALVIRVC